MPNYNYYPTAYNPYQVNPYQPQYAPVQQPIQYPQSMAAQPVQAPQQPVPAVQQPIMSSSVVNVRSEEEAVNWPVAPNNSVTLVDEIHGYLYTKTSFNQFDRPQFVKYKLVREDAAEAPVSGASGTRGTDIPYALKDDLTALAGAVQGVNENVNAITNTVAAMKGDIEKMSGDLYGIAGKKKSTAAAKKDADDE